MLNLQRKHLELIVALNSCDTLVEVAKQLHLTPSALSHQLTELEKRIDLTVVDRKTKPLHLTTAGKRLLETALDTLPRFERLENDLTRLAKGDSGRLTIAIECHSCYQWLIPTLNEFRAHWPAVELDIAGDFHFESLKGLMENELEIVITADPEPLNGIHYLPLFQYEAHLVLPLEHALNTVRIIEPVMLKSETLISYPVPPRKLDIFRLFLSPAGIEPAHIRHSELTVMMIALVASGRGVCALPSWAASEYTERQLVSTRSLGTGVFNTLYAAVRESSLRFNYMREFIKLARTLSLQTLQHIAPPKDQLF